MSAPANNNKKILDFFKPFAIPKNRIPRNDIIEDEIIVAPRKSSSPSETVRPQDASSPPEKRDVSRESSTGSTSFSDGSLPTTKLPIGTPQKRTRPSPPHGASDPTPIVSGPTSSQTRILKAVEIPSTHLPPPPPPPASVDVPDRAPSASFSSISTLSSAPMSSSSSSRRIVKNGMKAVTNSDSGSADSDSDELADPMTFVARKKRKLTPPGQDSAHPIEIVDSAQTGRQSNRISDMEKRSSVGSKSRLPKSPPRKVYEHSLLKLVKQREKEENAASRIREAEAAFEEAQKKREERMKLDQDIGSGLKAATADDSDEGDRMMLAMQRTEALQEEEKFYYFRRGYPRAPTGFSTAYDPNEDTSTPWMKLLRGEDSRRHAFLSGFVADMASKKSLPAKMYEWIASQLLFESNDDLREAYTEVLQVCTSQSFDLLQRFSRLECFYNTIETLSDEDRASIPDSQPPGLGYVVRFLQQLYSEHALLSNSSANMIVELAIAGADEHIKRDAGLFNDLHDTMESVLDVIPREEWFAATCESIHQAFFARDYLSQQLQCRIILSLPATSKRATHLRRLLALHLIANFTEGKDYRDDPQSSEWVKIIKDRLESAPEFTISQTTNYSLLDALVGILDIAIDAGFSESQYHPPISLPNKNMTHLTKSITSTAESRFNLQIDAITQPLRLMSSRIRGSGTSHLRRTEAKTSLERLILRLENSVRTRPKPRKGIFGGATGEQRAFLSGFLKSAATKEDEESDAVSVVPTEMLSDREISPPDETSTSTSVVSGAGET